MDIVIGEIRSTDSDTGGRDSEAMYANNRKRLRDRRKSRHDRRKSVRDGVHVSFSYCDILLNKTMMRALKEMGSNLVGLLPKPSTRV